MKRFAGFAVAAALVSLSLVSSAVPFANRAEAQQTATPAASLNFRDVAALGLNADGTRLLVADRSTDTAHIYDTTDIENPELLQTIELDGTPLDTAWINHEDGEFALIIVDSEDGILLQVLAMPNAREGWIPYAIYDMFSSPSQLITSIDGGWASAYGSDGSVLMQVISRGEINSSIVADHAIAAEALTETLLLAAGDESSQIAVGTPISGPMLDDTGIIELDDRVIALAAGRDELVAALTDAPAMILIEPSTQEITATLTLRSSATGLTFMPFSEGDFFAVFQPGNESISLIPIVRRAAGRPQTVTTANEVQQAAGAGSILVTTDGQQVDIYAVG
ncbi:MAG: hypothetical protein IAE89_03005 [Anaerolineae bacterium]|nr:hypothetical protein [Anaerolineae bacterium]